MSQARILSIVMIVVGLVLAVISAFADQIGLGAPGSTFGWKQLLGTVVGIAILIAGAILLRQGDVLFGLLAQPGDLAAHLGQLRDRLVGQRADVGRAVHLLLEALRLLLAVVAQPLFQRHRVLDAPEEDAEDRPEEIPDPLEHHALLSLPRSDAAIPCRATAGVNSPCVIYGASCRGLHRCDSPTDRDDYTM